MLKKKRFRSIDIFKGIAIIMVIMTHYQQNFCLGQWLYYFQMGCPIFFVCSGFGISYHIHQNYSQPILEKESLLSFYISRFKVLAPGWYLTILILFLINAMVELFTGSTLSFGSWQDPFGILLNLLFLHGFFPFCNNNVIIGGWFIGTLSILYLLTPLIIHSIEKYKNRWLFFVISSVLGMSFWCLLYFVFQDVFSSNGFGYFFFLVHYPEYLLGVMLYYDLESNTLNEHRINLCLPIGLLTIVLSYILYYTELPFRSIVSAWTTALGTYLTLIYMIPNEKTIGTKVGRLFEKFGQNSYSIFLLHAFWTFTFVDLTELIANQLGYTFKSTFGFVVLIPIILIGSYFTGVLFNKIIKNVTRLVFR